MKNRPGIFAFIISTLFFFACTKDKGIPMGLENNCNIPAITSYSKDVQPLFDQYCVNCHSGANPQGNLNLQSESYLHLMKPSTGYIDTINPKFSLLYAQMNSTSNPMPPSGKLDKCKTDLILKWIEQKAKNN